MVLTIVLRRLATDDKDVRLRKLRRLTIVFGFARSKDTLFKTKVADERRASIFFFFFFLHYFDKVYFLISFQATIFAVA